MITALRLVAADFRARGALLVAAILLVATPLAGYLLLHGFSRSIDLDFAAESSPDLIVQEANSVGEITGSRIPATVEQDLLDLGVPFAIPEIHSVAGSTAENAVLVRGIDSARYRSITRFDIVAGRALTLMIRTTQSWWEWISPSRVAPPPGAPSQSAAVPIGWLRCSKSAPTPTTKSG
jgi:hypothetical protein